MLHIVINKQIWFGWFAQSYDPLFSRECPDLLNVQNFTPT